MEGADGKRQQRTVYFLILAGYLFDIASKAIKLRHGISTPAYVWFFYILNSVIVAVGIAVWFRNKRLDRANGASSRGKLNA